MGEGTLLIFQGSHEVCWMVQLEPFFQGRHEVRWVSSLTLPREGVALPGEIRWRVQLKRHASRWMVQLNPAEEGTSLFFSKKKDAHLAGPARRRHGQRKEMQLPTCK